MKIATTTVTQTANEVLGVEVKNLYYLVIENSEGKRMIINVGKKTHDSVNALVNSENNGTMDKPADSNNKTKK